MDNQPYERLYSMGNLILAWRKARKGKTRRACVIEFEKDLIKNLLELHYGLKNKTYSPKPLKTSVLRDPKTRVISKSDFRDRVVHHALVNVISQIFEKRFIYDSCANQINKGTSFALKRFDLFKRRVTKNYSQHAFCLKADVKHYFQNVNHEILLSIIKKRINDSNIIWLIQQILNNSRAQIRWGRTSIGMPIGNLTSQFFANVYLHELDYFVKNKLHVRFYIRYVDDFVIFHSSKKQLEIWKEEISKFLKSNLKIELHQEKSRIIPLSRGIDFVGFRNFSDYRLLRKRNIKNMKNKIELFKNKEINFKKIKESYQGWQAYARWANTYKLRRWIKERIIAELLKMNLKNKFKNLNTLN